MRTAVAPSTARAPGTFPGTVNQQSAGFDYRYEFSETRKVLEEFFKAENEFPAGGGEPDPTDLEYSLTRLDSGSSYVGQRLAVADPDLDLAAPVVSRQSRSEQVYSRDLLDLVVNVQVPPPPPPPPPPALEISSLPLPLPRLSEVMVELPPPPPAPYHDSRNFTLSPETTDCDSADLESELSVPSAGEGSLHSSGPRHTAMPILEVSQNYQHSTRHH